MVLPTNPNPPSNMLIHGLCGIVGLLLTVLPSAWGQMAPTTGSRSPEQPNPGENHALASTTDRSTPLIVYRRDKQKPEVRQPAPNKDVRQPAADKIVTYAQPNLNDPRRLLPSSNKNSSIRSENLPATQKPSNNHRRSGIDSTFPSMEVLRSAGTGLGIALGLLLLCTWLFRRNMPSPTTPLPKEVVSVLGRAQLATRQFVQLLRVGNKLVLVSVTPEGTEPITEVTDPMEVDRLLGLCMRNHTQSTTAEFQHVLNQLSHGGAKGFLEK